MSDINMHGGLLLLPVVDSFKYRGSFVARDCAARTGGVGVDSKIELACKQVSASAGACSDPLAFPRAK